MTSVTAFHGSLAIKAELLSHIDVHLADDTLLFERTMWKDGRGSALGVSVKGTDPLVYTEKFGYPLALAAALDPLASFPAENFDARRFVRDWVEKVTPGISLEYIPNRLMLWMLDAPELRGVYDSTLTTIIELHRRDINSDTVTKSEWKQARETVLSLPDDTDNWNHRVKRMLEAASWTTMRGRSVLVDAISAWRNLAVREANDDWSYADEYKTEIALNTLWQEQQQQDDEGDPNYPAQFEQRDPELSRRFVANLNRTNRRFNERGAEIAVQCISLFQSVSRCHDDTLLMTMK